MCTWSSSVIDKTTSSSELEVKAGAAVGRVRADDHRRGRAPQRRGGLGAALLRGARPDRRPSGPARATAATRAPVLRRIAFIVFAQRVGLTLEEIGGELTKLPANRAPTRRDWSRLSSGWTERIDERIAELERLKVGLTECIGCGCLSLDRCAALQPGRPRRRARAPARATGSATAPRSIRARGADDLLHAVGQRPDRPDREHAGQAHDPADERLGARRVADDRDRGAEQGDADRPGERRLAELAPLVADARRAGRAAASAAAGRRRTTGWKRASAQRTRRSEGRWTRRGRRRRGRGRPRPFPRC